MLRSGCDIFISDLKRILQAAPLPVVCADSKQKIVFINNSAEDLFGLSLDHAAGRTLSTIIRSVDIESADVLFSDIPDAKSKKIEALGITRQGAEFPAEIMLTTIKQDGEQLTLMFAQNITERKRSLSWAERLLCAAEQSASTVVFTDSEGRIEYVNPKFTELTGYSLKEIRGKTPSIVKSGNTPREVYKELWDTITSGRVWRGGAAEPQKKW